MDVFSFVDGRIVAIGSCDAVGCGPLAVTCRDGAGAVVATFTIGEFLFFPRDGETVSRRGVFVPARQQAELLPGWLADPSPSPRRMGAALH
ncbi:hypothetical protein [Roseococcus sp.]|uniref:hypothetical protein n=1 Tax=Roseococcus sp. TaxID=2109646 RepID=UPI003BAA7B38